MKKNILVLSRSISACSPEPTKPKLINVQVSDLAGMPFTEEGRIMVEDRVKIAIDDYLKLDKPVCSKIHYGVEIITDSETGLSHYHIAISPKEAFEICNFT